MTKKFLVAALALTATVLLAANSFGQACSTGATVELSAVGSSAQFNTWAYAVADLLGGTGNFHLFSVKGNISNGPPAVPIAGLQDTRTSPATLDSATVWFMWNNAATCEAYAYFNVDSAIGQRIFFAMASTSTATKPVPAGLVYLDSSLNGGSGTGGSHNKVGGLPDTDAVLPSNVFLAYFGNGTTTFPVSFNAAPTDVRPEDALFETTRALTTIPATNTLAGMGYNNTACGAVAQGSGFVGCPIYTSFASSSYFNAISFAISGKDPLTGGAIPKFTTLATGAAPVVVIVGNGDTSAGGFGSVDGSGNYIFHNINRQVLSEIYQGRLGRTTDLLPNQPVVPGTGKPIQSVQREVLSGTYTTFEFTGIRTMSGSSNPASVGASTSLTSSDDSGQEQGNNPATNFSDTTNCPHAVGFPTGVENCGDPLFIQTPSGGLRLRGIGTGEEVPAALNLVKNQATSTTAAPDGIGYSFWSYGNLAPAASGCAGTSGTTDTCTTYLGHYLTVDGVDPFFNTPGGALDSTPNPWGAYNIPQCNLNATPCFNIPFPHIQDGTYPLWSLLRVATRVPTPSIVTQILNDAQKEVLTGTRQTSDFIPFEDGSGNLTLFVFRSHYVQSKVNPLNGHKTCTNFHPVTPATCLVDAGGDVGGAVLPVQADVDYHTDFGGVGGTTAPEIYGLHQ